MIHNHDFHNPSPTLNIKGSNRVEDLVVAQFAVAAVCDRRVCKFGAHRAPLQDSN